MNPSNMASFQEIHEQITKRSSKGRPFQVAMTLFKLTKYQEFYANPRPPSQFQTLGLSAKPISNIKFGHVQRTCDIFQRSTKKKVVSERVKKRQNITRNMSMATQNHAFKLWKYQEVDGASGRLTAHLGAPWGPQTPLLYSGAL